ncbi:MAG: porin [Thiohalomonadaceae bacterium]
MLKSVKHTLVATAVAAALGVAGNAAAETTVYGKIHISAGRISQDVAGVENSSTAVASHASRIGFKADKKLDNGMTIKGQLEYEVDTVGDKSKSSEDLIKARNTFVGLKGGFGEVRVGYHDTPHKMSTAKLDPLSDTYADYNNVVITDTRAKNAIAYLNKFGDLSVALAYSGGDDAVDEENAGAATSAMIAYESGPLFLAAAIENFDDVAAGDYESSTKLGVGYTFGDVKLGLVYDNEDIKDGNDDTAMYASLQWKVSGEGTVKAAYGQLDEDATNDDPTFYAVAYDHKLDKDASVYVLYASGSDGGLAEKAKLNGDGTATVVGMEFKF